MAAPNSQAFDIAGYLETNGVGTEGTDIFVSQEPDDPNFSITIYDTGGISPNPAYLRDEPTIQIRVRGDKNGYSTAWDKAQEIKDILLGADPVTLNGTEYVLFTQIGDILSLGYDENKRPLIISNWQLVREFTSGGNRVAL